MIIFMMGSQVQKYLDCGKHIAATAACCKDTL